MTTTPFEVAFRNVQRAVHGNSVEHGFWDDYPQDLNADQVAAKLALIHSEISEALEAVRDNYPESQKIAVTGQFEEELADAVIRIMDLAEYTGVDVAKALIEKAVYNRSRPFKHGKSI